MYDTVPTMMPGDVSWSETPAGASIMARPKSSTFSRPRRV
jgi:hypothetical protein